MWVHALLLNPRTPRPFPTYTSYMIVFRKLCSTFISWIWLWGCHIILKLVWFHLDHYFKYCPKATNDHINFSKPTCANPMPDSRPVLLHTVRTWVGAVSDTYTWHHRTTTSHDWLPPLCHWDKIMWPQSHKAVGRCWILWDARSHR